MVSSAYQDSSSGARIYPEFISGFLVQWEETFSSTTRRLWRLRQSPDVLSAQYLGVVHRDKMCVRS